MATKKSTKITVALITHDAYLPDLAKVVESINSQSCQPKQKILVYDGQDLETDVDLTGWDVHCLQAGTPNPLRNMATDLCTGSWIIFADGDDLMHPDYVAECNEVVKGKSVPKDLGIVYNAVEYHTPKGVQHLAMPESFDYWELRRSNYVSTTSCWLKAAITESGGWPLDTKCYDDWSLALAITRCGYVGKKGGGVIQVTTRGSGHRRTMPGDKSNKQFAHFWNHRSYAIVTLYAGRKHLQQNHLNWLEEATSAKLLPPNVTVYSIDNSRDPAFGASLQAMHDKLSIPCVYIKDNDTHKNRHDIVAKLYSRHLPEIREDFLVMLEDDVVPQIQGLRDLALSWNRHTNPGGIGGVYLSRHNGRAKWGPHSVVVASTSPSHWACNVLLKDIITHNREHPENNLIRMQQIAGGFTLWNNGVVQPSLPLIHGDGRSGIVLGWDSDLSFKAQMMGMSVWLHSRVFCDHLYRGTK